MTPPDLLAEAREIVATVFEGRGGASAKCARHVRSGQWDGDEEIEIALAARHGAGRALRGCSTGAPTMTSHHPTAGEALGPPTDPGTPAADHHPAAGTSSTARELLAVEMGWAHLPSCLEWIDSALRAKFNEAGCKVPITTAIRAIEKALTRPSSPPLDGEGIEELRLALQPFADCLEYVADDEPDDEWAKFRLLIGDYRRAAKALASISTPEKKGD